MRPLTTQISLTEELTGFIDRQVTAGGHASRSEYIRELIRREQDRESLRSMLLAGEASPLDAQPADDAYFAGLRQQVRG
jgi:antitoxin ParD1/3/4